MWMKEQGQAIIEFAIIIPFFILFLVGAFVLTMLFYNWMALSTMTRDAARMASLSPSCTTEDIVSMYTGTNTSSVHLPNLIGAQGFYTWDAASDASAVQLASINNGEGISVTMTAKRAKNYQWLPATIQCQTSMHLQNTASSQ